MKWYPDITRYFYKLGALKILRINNAHSIKYKWAHYLY